MTEASEAPACPRCGKERFEGTIDCPFCGIVFARFDPQGPDPSAPEGPIPEGVYAGPEVAEAAGPTTSDPAPNPGAGELGSPAPLSRPIQILEIPKEQSRIADFLQFDLTRSVFVTLFASVLVTLVLGQIFGGATSLDDTLTHHFNLTGAEAPFSPEALAELMEFFETEGTLGDLHLVGREFLFLGELSADQSLEAGVVAASRRTVRGHQSQEEMRQDAYRWLGAIGANVVVIRSVDTAIRGRPARVDILHPANIPGGIYVLVATVTHGKRPAVLILGGTRDGLERLAKHYFDDNLRLRRAYRDAPPQRPISESSVDPIKDLRLGYLLGSAVFIGVALFFITVFSIRFFIRWLDIEGGFVRALLVLPLSMVLSLVLLLFAGVALGIVLGVAGIEPSDTMLVMLVNAIGTAGAALAVLILYSASKREALIVALGSTATSYLATSLLAILFYGF